MGHKIAHGIVVWVQYLVIGMLAAVFAYFALLAARFNGEDICLSGIFRFMWRDYLAPWLTAYLVLSSARLLIVLAHHRFSGTPPAIDMRTISRFGPRILTAATTFAITLGIAVAASRF